MIGNAPDEEHIDPHGECRHEIHRLHSALATARREADDLIELLRKTYGPIASIKLFNPDGDERYPQLHRELLHQIRDAIERRALLSQSVEVGRAEPRGEEHRRVSRNTDADRIRTTTGARHTPRLAEEPEDDQ